MKPRPVFLVEVRGARHVDFKPRIAFTQVLRVADARSTGHRERQPAREGVGAEKQDGYVTQEIEREIAAGHAVHFMDQGCYYERTWEGVFEVVPIDDVWVRTREVARRLWPANAEEGAPPARKGGGGPVEDAGTTAANAMHSDNAQRVPSIVEGHYDRASDAIVARLSTGATIIVRMRLPRFNVMSPRRSLRLNSIAMAHCGFTLPRSGRRSTAFSKPSPCPDPLAERRGSSARPANALLLYHIRQQRPTDVGAQQTHRPR
jgi:hypothetical protein